MGSLIINMVILNILLSLEFFSAEAQTWIRAGYWQPRPDLPISSINSTLFTHLICSCADIDSSSYQLSSSSSVEQQMRNFTNIVKQINPSITTLLSIGSTTDYSTLTSMVNDSSYRKSFIDSSIGTARLYGFDGLDFDTPIVFPRTGSEMLDMGTLFQEWRSAMGLEAKNSSLLRLILTATVSHYPWRNGISYPVDSIQGNLNWVHLQASKYVVPTVTNVTAAQAALYDPNSSSNTDYGLKQWMDRGLSSNKLVLCLPFYGYAWTLVNSTDNGIGAPATGPAVTENGLVSYKRIEFLIHKFGPGVQVKYNSTYVMNYCTVNETTWIGFDDVEAIQTKVSYAKEKQLLGYYAWLVSYDDNWVLSQAAADALYNKITSLPPGNNESRHRDSKRRLWVIVSIAIIALILLLGFSIYYCWMRKLKLKGTLVLDTQSKDKAQRILTSEDFNNSGPNLKEYTYADVEIATNGFSIENKLGEGGYGPVYKGALPDGQEIAVKKLSKTSKQGFEEFKNEVMFTAKVQHINLVRVLGYCVEREERMLIYEYLPNKSLDYYLFDPMKRDILDWSKRVNIIEGITQGLVYLQEYSRFTIIHRDLKASNVLLNKYMKPKISDFGMARIFVKDDLEANTSRIVGTYGYVPPEYVQRGAYSTKLDVYSFGVLLLQIISGKKVSFLNAQDKWLSLPQHAYELWECGKGKELMDPSLDATDSKCKLMRCLQIALLCVQENPEDRPSMLEISSMLKTETMDIMLPKKPAFLEHNNERELNEAALNSERCSINDVTITEMVAR